MWHDKLAAWHASVAPNRPATTGSVEPVATTRRLCAATVVRAVAKPTRLAAARDISEDVAQNLGRTKSICARVLGMAGQVALMETGKWDD